MTTTTHQDFDYTGDNSSLKKTLMQVAGTAAGAAAVAALPVELPVVAATVVMVTTGIAASKLVGAIWDLF